MKTVTIDPDVLGGVPCFTGTRVPVSTLFDMLRSGDSLKDFFEDFPTVSRELVEETLMQSEALLEAVA